MATSNYTTLLGLALPTTGDLSGQWGNEVNSYITEFVDTAVAGSLTITGDVTLTKTTGTSLGATSSQYAVLIASGLSANTTVTAPAASKVYVVNNTSSLYTLKIRGAGPTTGVTLAASEKAVVAWNGSDFVKIASSATDGVSTISFGTTGLTPAVATDGAVTVGGTLSTANGGTGSSSLAGANIAVFNASNTFTAAQTFRASNAVRSEVAATQDAVIVSGRAGGSNSYAVTLTPTTLTANRTLTLPDSTGTVATVGTAVAFSIVFGL